MIPNLDVCGRAARQRRVERIVEFDDLVTGDRGRVRSKEASGERGLCNRNLMGSHSDPRLVSPACHFFGYSQQSFV